MMKNSVIFIHLMNENTGYVGDITYEVGIVEKLHNQEICLTIRPEHQDEHHEAKLRNDCISKRKDIQEKTRARPRPRIQEGQCRQRCDAG
jgi:hypothetical protein